MDKDKIDRAVFNGASEDWEPSPEVKLKWDAAPVLFFLLFLPVTFLVQLAQWSEKYAHYVRMKKDKEFYPQRSWKPYLVYMFIAALFLHGINSLQAQEDLFSQTLAFPGHSVGWFMNRGQWRFCMATT